LKQNPGDSCCGKGKKLRILVVDDSAFMRRVIGDIIEAQADMELAGIARNGEEAIQKIEKIAPDLVTMDLEMPLLDGISTLKKIMSKNPLPVIIVSSHSLQGSESTLEALNAGAVDFVPKPAQSRTGETLEELKKTLPLKIRAAANARLEIINQRKIAATFKEEAYTTPTNEKPTNKKSTKDLKLIVAIGASTGGPKAVEEVLRKLPADLPAAIMITQHMPSGFTKSFAHRLDLSTPFRVVEAQSGGYLQHGDVFIAPGNYHLILGKDERLELHQGERLHHVRPAFDIMLESLVYSTYGIIAVILTGMGKDGSLSTVKLKKHKRLSRVIVQDPSTAVVRGMPEAVIATGCHDLVAPLSKIPGEIVQYVKELQKEIG